MRLPEPSDPPSPESEILVRSSADDEVVLVAFGGLHLRVGITDFEFFDITDGLSAELIFLRDRTRRVYHGGLPALGKTFPEMARGLESLIRGRPWVAVGNSGGGFAALLFGALAGATEVHAFAAVTFLDARRRRQYGDDRFAVDIDRINQAPGRQRRFLDVRPWMRRCLTDTDFHLYYAADYELDRLHAERLRRVRRTTLHPGPGKGHAIIRDLALSGDLRRILTDSVANARERGRSGRGLGDADS